MIQTATAPKRSRKKPVPKIPEYLVCEVVRGQPLYYKGYKDVLNKTKTFEEIIMESKLQAGLKAEITALLYFLLKKLGYQLATGELGLNLSREDKRGADLAIFKAENWSWDNKFSDLPPEVVIEIDVQAQMEDQTEMDYVGGKIRDYLAFGVKKIIWIFTKEKLVFVATEQLPWLTYDWNSDIEVVEGVRFTLNDLVKTA
jgi:Uma2 family endonuclease